MEIIRFNGQKKRKNTHQNAQISRNLVRWSTSSMQSQKLTTDNKASHAHSSWHPQGFNWTSQVVTRYALNLSNSSEQKACDRAC